MSINRGTQNIEILGNSADTLRLMFRALDVKIFPPDSIEKTSLFQPRPRFTQSHSPNHQQGSSKRARLPQGRRAQCGSATPCPQSAACPAPTADERTAVVLKTSKARVTVE